MEEMQLLPKFLMNSGKQENFIHNAVRKDANDDDEADEDD
jgi:hypothetical protein